MATDLKDRDYTDAFREQLIENLTVYHHNLDTLAQLKTQNRTEEHWIETKQDILRGRGTRRS